jgi:radical SAM protein with 4Fe4S-binding SPASM domain
LLSIRHMVIFQDRERPQTLLDDACEANAALREVYAELDRLGLRHESPPLMVEVPKAFNTSIRPTRLSSNAAAPGQGHRPTNSCDRIAKMEAECNWMHRTAIIMSDGEVTSCGKHYGMQVGYLDNHNSLWDLWNGPKMRSLRESWGKPEMWEQCKACWLREIKWHSQRQAKDLGRNYDLRDSMDFSEAAWDYRAYSEL